MNKRDFIAAIRRAKVVFANVQLTANDCWYVQVVKANLLLAIEGHGDTTIYQARETGDELYVD